MGRGTRVIGLALAAASLVTASVVARQDAGADRDLQSVLHRVGQTVERYFARAQSIVCLETVTWLPLDTGPALDTMPREIESELSLAWDAVDGDRPAREIKTVRRVLTVNGRPPRRDDPRNCTTPEQTDTETAPLSMLLPGVQEEYRFKLAGPRRERGRDTVILDFVEKARPTVTSSLVEGKEDCLSYTIDGGTRGRIWIDARSFDVLRLDQHVGGMLDIPLPRRMAQRVGHASALTLERAMTTVRFEPVEFHDPDEILVLPVSVIEMRETRGSGIRRLRTTTDYSGYRRFLTGGRIVR